MKNRKTPVLALLVSLITGMAASCVSTGDFMPLSKEETVLGTVQATFVVRSSFFSMKSARDVVNTQAYIKLMEAAGEKYTGSYDIRDIVWVTGRTVFLDNTEISATGKVVSVAGTESASILPEGSGSELTD